MNQPQIDYRCVSCNTVVRLVAGQPPIRTCGHVESGVTASVKATVFGRGTFSQHSPYKVV